MAGKPTVFASKAVHYTLDGLSKNTLIDFIVDLARAELGEDASDDAVVAWIQDRINPTIRQRDGKSIFLKRRMQSFRRTTEEYLDKAVDSAKSSIVAEPIDSSDSAVDRDIIIATHVQKSPIELYRGLKAQYPGVLILFRVGDFYELFFDDAHTVARVLGLTLTSRFKASTNPVPMAGFPYHQLDNYLRRLIQAGLRAAICEHQ